jgi:hypothetical protein
MNSRKLYLHYCLNNWNPNVNLAEVVFKGNELLKLDGNKNLVIKY